MTDKAKRIIHSVGVFLTGAIFSMTIMGIVGCHVQNAYSEEASSLRQKRQQQGTTDGGYTSFYFELPEHWDETTTNTGMAYVYSLDTTDYTPTLLTTLTYPNTATALQNKSVINTIYETARPTSANELYFLAYFNACQVWGSTYYYTGYFSFMTSTAGSQGLQPRSFLMTPNWTQARGLSVETQNWLWGNTNQRDYILSYERSDVWLLDLSTGVRAEGEPLTTIRFQDSESYFKEVGYQSGHTAGHADGYQEGYADGSESSMLFTDLGVNQMLWYRADLHIDAQTDTTASYELLTFKDGSNQTYSVWASHYFAGTGNDDFLSVDLYSSTSPNSASYVTQLGKGITNYATSGTTWEMFPSTYKHFDFAQITGVFNNSIPMNYFMISGLPDNATGYQQGYNKGYQDALSSSASGVALDNVFGLFSKAFGSVASFFNLKVFGFLPLYWFFLVPIFIAVITLLLRMVKH